MKIGPVVIKYKKKTIGTIEISMIQMITGFCDPDVKLSLNWDYSIHCRAADSMCIHIHIHIYESNKLKDTYYR